MITFFAYLAATKPHNPAPAPNSSTFLSLNNWLLSIINLVNSIEAGHMICPVRSKSVDPLLSE